MTQTYQIGKEYSGSFNQRLEWRLNQLQSAIAGGGSSPAVEALLTDLLAVMETIQQQTDGIELTSENINLNADEINLNTDQVEALLAAIETSLATLVTQTDTIETSLGTLLTQTDGIEPSLTTIETSLATIETGLGTLVTQTDGIESVLQAISDEITSSVGNGGVISSLVVPLLQQIRTNSDALIEYLKPLEHNASTPLNAASHPVGTAYQVNADPLRRGLSISNNTGDATDSAVPLTGEAWIFGSYRNSSVDRFDYDFVVVPGQTLMVDAPSGDVWLVCDERSGLPDGIFMIVEFY